MPITNFVWDELSDNVRMEVDDAGVTTVRYANEPGQFGELISLRRNSVNSFHHYDAQGSSRQLTNDAEDVSDSYTYLAFGEKVSSFGSTTNPFQYNGAFGYYSDSETGEVYVRRRTYQPEISRWLSADPLGVLAGPVYLYLDNSPVKYSDPSGLDSDCGCCCCVDGADYSHTRLEEDLPRLATHWWGHYLTHTSKLRFPPGEGDGLGCRIEWFECSTTDGSLGQKAGEWFTVHDSPKWRDTDTDWDDYYDGKLPFDCPGGALTLEWKDQPKLPFASSRNLKFVIRVSSDPSCSCEENGINVRLITVAFTQRLLSTRGARFDPIKGFIMPEQWTKWEITGGIKDEEKPTECKRSDIPFATSEELSKPVT